MCAQVEFGVLETFLARDNDSWKRRCGCGRSHGGAGRLRRLPRRQRCEPTLAFPSLLPHLAALHPLCPSPLLVKPNDSRLGGVQDEELKAKGINPRTGQPYQRGGAYNKNKEKEVGAALKAAEAAAKLNEKKAGDKATIADLRGQIATLTAQLAAEKNSKELAVSAAKLEVEQRMAKDLLAKYKEGLRDGSSLSSGKGMNGSPAFGIDGSPL